MRIVIAKIGEPAQEAQNAGTLAEMQAVVGGYLERLAVAPLLSPSFDLWVNEDGKLRELGLNRSHPTYGPLRGDIFIAKHDRDGNMIDLNNNEVAQLIALLNLWRKP